MDNEEKINKRLDEIALALQNGADPDDFQDELDSLLGTEMPERNTEAEQAYESARHGE